MSAHALQKNPVIAHRGAWRLAGLPQNSVAALRRALELGCYGSECDIQLTADNVLVAAHDDTWYGMPIATTDYGQLSRHRLGNGEVLPRLETLLAAIMAGGSSAGGADDTVEAGAGGEALSESLPLRQTKLIIELKPSALGLARTQEAVGLLLGEVAAAGAQARVEYILFSLEAALLLAATDPEAHVSYLGGDLAPELLKAQGLSGFDYAADVLQRQPEWIARARELGLASNVWTVNEPESMRQLLDAGIERITTDEPELLLAWLHSREHA